ncbi:putative ribonuclease H-like domain-containing protein [Tanacetum coccineum]
MHLAVVHSQGSVSGWCFTIRARLGEQKQRASTVSPSVSAARQSFINTNNLSTDPLMPDLEDTTDLLNIGIFSGAYDDEDLGAEADHNNLETTMNMDVKSAFLYGTIEEEVYVCQPPSFEDPQFPDKVYKVEKALYGAHQAPRAWFDAKKFQMGSIGTLTFFLRSMIGSLMYLTASRPDIMFVVYACARFQLTPKVSHLHALKRIFRYLKGQPKLGLWYPRDSPFDLEAFSDSDYAGAMVANSTTKVEYVAATNCCGQVLWIQNQMLDYGFNFVNTMIYIDNESTISIVKNPVFHSKTKHIEIRYHFIRDSYEKKLIQVIKIQTNHNVADLFTKAFDVSRFALSENPTIYDSHIKQFWQTATVNTLDNGEQEITTIVDGPCKLLTIDLFRNILQLADAGGLSSLLNTEIFDQLSLMGDATTVTSIDAGHGSGNITKSPTMPYDSPLPGGHTLGSDEGSMTLHEFGILCTQFCQTGGKKLEIELKQTKQTYGAAFTKLIKKVKKLEQTVKTSKAKRRRKIIASDDEEDLVVKDPFKQGRSMIEVMDLDAGISLVPPYVENLTTTKDTYSDRKKCLLKAKGKAKMDETESPRKMKQREQVQISRLLKLSRLRFLVQQLQAGEKVIVKNDLQMMLVDIIGEASGSGEESAEKEKELSEEELQKLLVIVPVEEVYVEALQFKYPIIDWEVYYEDKEGEIISNLRGGLFGNNGLSVSLLIEETTTDDSVYKTKVSETETSISKTSKDIVEKPKTVRPSAPIIEDWDTDSDNDSVFRPKTDQTKPKFTKINFVKSDENVKSVNKENTHKQVEYPRKSQSPRGNRRNWNGMMTQKLGNGFEFIKKACFVCGSFNHLIKDCDFHDNKMVEKPVLNNKGRVTGQREIRPVWNNAQRVNHQNKFTHPHPKRNFVPTAVVTKSGQVPVNAAKQNSLRAAASISTARPVNTVVPKSKVNVALPKTYSYFKAHSPVRRAFNQKSAAKIYNLNEKVKTARVNNVTTAGPKAVVSAAVGNGQTQDQGIFDSGRSRHMTRNKSFLIDYQEIDGRFVAFGGSPKGGKITGKGGLTCLFAKATIDESNLWHKRLGHINFKTMNKLVRGNLVRGLPSKLFENDHTCVACQKGKQHKASKSVYFHRRLNVLFLSPDFKLLDESQVLLKVPRQNNMYSFDLKNVVPSGGLAYLFAKAAIDESKLWHRRLSHINFKTMNKLVKRNLVRGLPSKLFFENDHDFFACQRKATQTSLNQACEALSANLYKMLHKDLFGPTSVRSINHKTYCLVVTDDYSRFSWVFFLAIKDETSGILKTFITGIENQINHKVKIIRCDNGTEFKNNDMNQFCRMKGIKREFSVVRTP